MVNKLVYPPEWNEVWTKYPHGLTIFEAVVDWVNKVNALVDLTNTTQQNVLTFYESIVAEIATLYTNVLPTSIEIVLDEWHASGKLADLINLEILGGIETQLAQKAKKNLIDVADYGAKGDYYLNDGSVNPNHIDNAIPIQEAINYAYSIGWGILIANGTFMSSNELRFFGGMDVYFENAIIKIPFDSVAEGVITNGDNMGGGVTQYTEKLNFYNPRIDGSDKINRNGFGFINCKNVNLYNPMVENIRHGVAGGKAFQFENGENGVVDCNVYNPIIKNSSIGCNAQGFGNEPAKNINFYNVMMENVDVPFNFDSTGTLEGALSHSEMSVLVDGFSLRNCGKITQDFNGASALDGGILTLDRAYGVVLRNGKVVNDIAYGTIGGLVRGKGRNIQLDNITIEGNVVALFNGDIKRFVSASTGSIPAEYNARNIRHFGNADYVVVGYAPQPDHMKNCYLQDIEVDNVITGILDINASKAGNSYAIIRHRNDNYNVPLLNFLDIWNNGNNLKPFRQWENINFVNSWAGDYQPRYFKDSNGVVHVSGAAIGGINTDGTIIFNLPYGYRPPNRIFVNGRGWSPSGQVIVPLLVSIDGSVSLSSLDVPTEIHFNFSFISW